jgi:ligand-binding sensor domain-containing protein
MHPFRDNKGAMPFAHIPFWSLVHIGDWLWAGSAKGLYKINKATREVIKLRIQPVLKHGIIDISMDGDSSCWISSPAWYYAGNRAAAHQKQLSKTSCRMATNYLATHLLAIARATRTIFIIINTSSYTE